VADQIAIGQYPAGAYLPSVRELAKELGINRNTVSRVYQELRRDGVLESIHGLGVRVTGPARDLGNPDDGLAARIESFVRDAHRARVSKESLLARVAGIAGDTYDSLSARIALVGCTRADTEDIARELSQHLSLEIEPIVLADLVDDPVTFAQRYDVASTTLFHLQEVREALAGLPPVIVGMKHVVSHGSILPIARLKPGTRIGLVCENPRTLALVQGIIQLYVRDNVRGTTRAQLDEIRRMAAEVDVIVDHSLTHEFVRAVAPDVPTMTVKFHIEPRSIEFLRDVALQRHALAATVA
jgi:GntR family transcriptional regulator